MQLSRAESRIRELETQLADRSSETAATRRVAALEGRERELSTQLEQAKAESATLREDLNEAKAATEAALAAARASGDPSAAPQIAVLEAELETERTRRVSAEDQLARMREETSASPYETNDSQTALKEAQSEIDRLSQQLGDEKRERDDLERRFAELRVQLEEQAAVPGAAAETAEMIELQEDQRRLIAAIQQDLEGSRRREEELRTTLASMQGAATPDLTDKVENLAAENIALQSSLDSEHERNVELAAKLEVATRVADLIFKMRREGQVPSPQAIQDAQQP